MFQHWWEGRRDINNPKVGKLHENAMFGQFFLRAFWVRNRKQTGFRASKDRPLT